jgi:hypothetical protein
MTAMERSAVEPSSVELRAGVPVGGIPIEAHDQALDRLPRWGLGPQSVHLHWAGEPSLAAHLVAVASGQTFVAH